MQKITLCISLFLVLQLSVAQAQQFGHLTIFSEDGDKFTLILNGEKINDFPQTNLRVEELTQPHYNAKIIFEDKTKTEISKNFLPIADVDGIFEDVTYKIKRDKNNASKMKLNFFSSTPVVQGFVAPSNVYVTRYGSPAAQVVVQQNTPVTSTVTQTTTTTTGVGINAGMNVGGIGINVSVNDPGFGTTVTETTTVHSSTTTGYAESAEPSSGCAGRYPMSGGNFSNALQTVKNINFDDSRLATAKQIADSNCLSASQVVQICETFGFEDTKLDFAKYAYSACCDPKNYFQVNNVFKFSSNVDALNAHISGR